MPHQAPPTTAEYVYLLKLAGSGAFAGGEAVGTLVTPASDTVTLDPSSLCEGSDPQVYSRGAYLQGDFTSAVYTSPVPFDTAVLSWNADVPDGTWIEVQVRGFRAEGEHWTRYYSYGYWAESSGTIGRRSIQGQTDSDGTLATDTLRLSAGPLYTAFQYRLRLYTIARETAPAVRLISVLVSDSMRHGSGLQLPAMRDVWGTDLLVPQQSQMLYEPHGKVWCSPTCTSMVIAYWGSDVSVLDAAEGTFDLVYRGTGNWPFNTAWAARFGLEAYITRLTALAQVEAWIGAGVPVILSVGFEEGELDGAPVAWTDGHLLVVRGFDQRGDVIVNDPAASGDAEVRRAYRRDQVERVWLEHSGGIVYLIHPAGHPVPAHGSFGCW